MQINTKFLTRCCFLSRRNSHFTSNKSMLRLSVRGGSSRAARVVHSDWPEIKAMKKYVSVVEKIGLNVLNAKSLETQRRIRGGILWVEIIPLMDLTQFGLKEQYSLAQDRHGLRNSHGGLRSFRVPIWTQSHALSKCFKRRIRTGIPISVGVGKIMASKATTEGRRRPCSRLTCLDCLDFLDFNQTVT